MSRNDLAFLDQHARTWGGDDYAEWFMLEFGAEAEVPDISHPNQFDRFLRTEQAA